MNLDKLEAQLVRHEGVVLDMYRDSVGIWTIGIGRNLEHVGLRNEAEARYLLRSDIVAIRTELEKALPWIGDLNDVRQSCMMDMAFNMGVAGLMKFEKTLRLAADGHFSGAAQEMLRSRWAGQVGQRAITLSEMMATGKDE